MDLTRPLTNAPPGVCGEARQKGGERKCVGRDVATSVCRYVRTVGRNEVPCKLFGTLPGTAATSQEVATKQVCYLGHITLV